MHTPLEALLDTDAYAARHLGSDAEALQAMLEAVGAASMAEFLRQTLLV